MNLQETIIQLNELKLRGMSSSFEAMTSLPVQNRPSLEGKRFRVYTIVAFSFIRTFAP